MALLMWARFKTPVLPGDDADTGSTGDIAEVAMT